MIADQIINVGEWFLIDGRTVHSVDHYFRGFDHWLIVSQHKWLIMSEQINMFDQDSLIPSDHVDPVTDRCSLEACMKIFGLQKTQYCKKIMKI